MAVLISLACISIIFVIHSFQVVSRLDKIIILLQDKKQPSDYYNGDLNWNGDP